MKSFKEVFYSGIIPKNIQCTQNDNAFDIYEKHLSNLQDKEISFLEISNQTLGSIHLWKEYFEKGRIYGLCTEKGYKRYAVDGTRIFSGDQNNPLILNDIVTDMKELTVVIDNGDHICKHQQVSFEYLFPYLVEGGVYIILETRTSYWKELEGFVANEKSFLSFAKDLIGCVTWWAMEPPKREIKDSLRADRFDEWISSIHFYNDICVICKGSTNLPNVCFARNVE